MSQTRNFLSIEIIRMLLSAIDKNKKKNTKRARKLCLAYKEQKNIFQMTIAPKQY